MISVIISGAFQGAEAWIDTADAIKLLKVEQQSASRLLESLQTYHEPAVPLVICGSEYFCQNQAAVGVFIKTIMRLEQNHNIVVCIADIGAGLVPIDPDERRWRELVGRTTTQLVKEATFAFRMVAGILLPLKQSVSIAHGSAIEGSLAGLLRIMSHSQQQIELVLVRHGITLANQEKRYLSRQDIPLCADGIKQLEMKLGETPQRISQIYCSPSLRTRQTAAILWPKQMLEIMPELQERDFGDFDHLTYADLETSVEYREFIRTCGATTPPNGESWESFWRRLTLALGYIIRQAIALDYGRVAVISHGGSLMVMRSLLDQPHSPNLDYSKQMSPGETVTVSVLGTLGDQLLVIN